MKDKIITYSFITLLIIFMILGILIKDNDISLEERRKLAKFPDIKIENIFKEDYVNKFEKYFLDQFTFRNSFRKIKAEFNYKILGRLENNGIYVKDNAVYKSDYPTNDKSISKFISNIENTMNYFSKDNNIYMMIIPDKNYYLDSKDFLKIDYDMIYSKISSIDINQIDVRDYLNLDDYYRTDTHWRQEKLDKVIKVMCDSMILDYRSINYKNNYYDSFYGVYYSDNVDKDNLIYLTNDTILNSKVMYLENKELSKVYNLDNLGSMDSYGVYLDGASSFIEIENKNSSSDRELVIFRDSFASSITPLLIEYYSKITLIDNRYISSDYYLDLIDFDKQDILFMYSTLIVNNSSTLKG